MKGREEGERNKFMAIIMGYPGNMEYTINKSTTGGRGYAYKPFSKGSFNIPSPAVFQQEVL